MEGGAIGDESCGSLFRGLEGPSTVVAFQTGILWCLPELAKLQTETTALTMLIPDPRQPNTIRRTQSTAQLTAILLRRALVLRSHRG